MFLGIDGGGTKTTFVLLDRDGTIRATHPGGCAYYLEVGMAPLRAMINDGIRALLGTAGVDITAVGYAFLGRGAGISSIRPVFRATHSADTGHFSHAGLLRVHTVAPRSIRPWV